MNPLAKTVNALLAAIGSDPQYTEVCKAAQLELAQHTIELYAVGESGRYAPILVQCAMHGFTEEDYEHLEKAMGARCAKRKAAAIAEYMQIHALEMHKAQMEMYKARLASAGPGQVITTYDSTTYESMLTGPVNKKPWYKL